MIFKTAFPIVFLLVVGIPKGRSYEIFAVIQILPIRHPPQLSTNYYQSKTEAERAAAKSAATNLEISNVCVEYPLNPCDVIVGQCIDLQPSLVKCTCPNGYLPVLPAKANEALPKPSECVDIDECTGNSTACGEHTELCINLRGSYTCVCKPGFVLSPDRICIPSQSVTSPFTKSTAEGTARGGLITKLAGRMFQGKSAATAKMLFATNSFENNFSTNQQSTVSRLQNINATPATSNRLNSSSSIRMFTGDDATTESTAFLVNATGSPTSYAMSASQTVIVPGLFTGYPTTTSGGKSAHGESRFSVHIIIHLLLFTVVAGLL